MDPEPPVKRKMPPIEGDPAEGRGMDMKARVLVVEDEFITATEIENSLKALGYDVPAVVDNGEEAIRMTGEMHPSLVLMDIGLKGRMSGIEAGRQIQERFDIPVIYLTGHGDESTFWSALASEPYGYILKPFETRELKFGIEMALHKHGESHGIEKDRMWKTGQGGGSPSPVDGKGIQGNQGAPGGILKKLPAIFLISCVAFFILFTFFPLNPPPETQYGKNVEIVREIAQGYHSTHTYLGVQTGQSSNIYDCIDMAKDVWDMIKTRGINAVIVVGNVKKNITTINDVNHAWVMAEVGPMQWLAIETTGGYVVTRDENPLYYSGMQFDNPAEMKVYLCGKDYCWSNTCVNNQCMGCTSGYILGSDLQCHPECGSTYCTGNSACVNGQCIECDSGSVLGTDNRCHSTCIDAVHYCLPGYVCGSDNKCHPAAENATQQS